MLTLTLTPPCSPKNSNLNASGRVVARRGAVMRSTILVGTASKQGTIDTVLGTTVTDFNGNYSVDISNPGTGNLVAYSKESSEFSSPVATCSQSDWELGQASHFNPNEVLFAAGLAAAFIGLGALYAWGNRK